MFKKMLIVLAVAAFSFSFASLAQAQEAEEKGPLSLSIRGNMINSDVFEDIKFEAETEFGFGVAAEYDLPWLKGLSLEAAVDRLNLFDQEVYVKEEMGNPIYEVYPEGDAYEGQLKYAVYNEDGVGIGWIPADEVADCEDDTYLVVSDSWGDKHNISFWKSPTDADAYKSTPEYHEVGIGKGLRTGYSSSDISRQSAEFDSTVLSLSLKYNFGQFESKKLVPYLLGGIGYCFNDFSLFDVDNSFETHAGAGLNYLINDSWAMYAEGRYLWSTADVSDTYADALGNEVELDSFIVMTGIKYRF